MTPDTVFKCLGDETRLMATLLIFNLGELCVCDLMVAMGESQPKISRHLAQLRSCGLLNDERRGQWVFYSMPPTRPAWIDEVLNAASKAHEPALHQAIKSLGALSRGQAC